jgi:NADH:ubiquinone oxidoreductase subunit 4 (subunit M)
MNATLDTSILSLVTFVPLAGSVMLVLFPRRDRDIRLFALVVSLLDFVLSLHLPVHLQRGSSGFQYEVNNQCLASSILEGVLRDTDPNSLHPSCGKSSRPWIIST